MAEQISQQSSKETEVRNNDLIQRQPKKMVTSTVKDVISKGRTMTGKKPDQIDMNPVKENADLFKQISDIYDRFFEDSDRTNTYKREWGTESLTDIYKNDTPGQVVNDKFGLEFKNPQRDKEANTRSGNPDRKEIDLVPRNDPERDRKKDSTFFRQQSITKRRKDIGEDINNAFSEAYGKEYKSPWNKIEKAKPGIGKRIDAAVAGLKQNAADYQAIINKEKKQTKNESVNAAGAGTVRGFGNVSGNPDGSDIGSSYVNANIADADTKDNIIKAQVKAHADLHVVGKDNTADKKVAKEEVDLGETSKSLMNRYTAKLILKHPDVMGQHPIGRDIQRKKALNLAMDKLIPSSAINKPKVSATEETVKEDLRQWFKDKWVRMDTKGNIKGDCAREPGEGKPKCLPVAKARAMDKKDRAAAARRKRREDPVADRPGKGGAPINVRTEAVSPAQQAAIAISLIKAGKKKGKDPGPQKEEVEHLEEKNKPTNPALWSRAKSLARSKFDVYPSAYANGWAAKWYKSKGGGWKSANEEFINEENWYTTEPQQDGTHKVTKINNQKNPYNHKVGDTVSKGDHTLRQYTSDGSAYGSEVKKEQYDIVSEMGKKGTFRPVSPGVQNVRTAQAATRGDKALDKEYHYGTTKGGVSPIASKRREQGFGAVANYNSAQAALTAKKQGANPKGQDAAIHKGWGKTVDQMPAANPEKQAARKKLQQTPFSSLSKGEQEKDTVLRKGITKEEVVNEISNELIGKVNKIRTLTGIPSKTPTASDTLNKAVEKVRRRTDVGKVKS